MKLTLVNAAKFLLFKNSREQFIREWMSSSEDHGDGDVHVTSESALKYSAVFGCIRVLSETFASVPVKEYRKQKNGDRIETDETGLYDILHNETNSEMSAFSFKEMAMMQLNTGGNIVCERIYNKLDEVIALNPFTWDRVTIARGDDGILKYVVKGKSEDKTYVRNKIFHIAGPSTNGIVGMSPIEYAASSIKLGMYYEKFCVEFYKNGAFPTGVFEAPGHLNDDAYLRLKNSIKEEYTSLRNAGTPLLLEDGVKYNGLTMKMIDAELLASKKFQIEDVCRIYRVPLHLVQNLDKATNNNIEHQSLEFAMYTMLPWFKRFEDGINTQLLSKQQRKEGYYFEFNMSSLLRGDQKSMAEAFAQGRQWGWLSVNDIRRLLNMNGIGPAGDIYLQPMNMVEAGKQAVTSQYKALLDEVQSLIESRSK